MPKQGDDSQSELPRTGRLSRGAIAGMAVARAGLAHLGHKAQSLTRDDAQQAQARVAHEAELGRILFAALNQLKGTALKASQLMSTELGFLPEGMRQELARAHYQVTPLNRAVVVKVLRQEFGNDPHTLFQHFEPQAFAAASLGQVHTATLANGHAVAVKLQYPGMAASIGSDMRMLRSLLQTLGGHSEALPKASIIERVMADIECKLAEELDYLHEAQALQWFAQHLTLPGLVIPQPVMDRTTQRVLTMQRLQGQHVNEWLQSQPSQAQRDRYGQLLFDTFLHCAFVLRRLQADPHPGNYLFLPDGRLGLLDFGCTRALDAGFCTAVSTVWSALLHNPVDTARLQQAYQALGLIRADLSTDDFCTQLLPALAAMQAWQRLPFTVPVYDFAQHPPYPGARPEHQRQAVQFLQAVPPDLPYFDRAYLGLTQLLRTLGARVRTTNPWIG
jgi:predicted unusual protein kinase regulating ubiquinone biosynthesis (AarF/ABC1/UbiB family)